MKYIIPNLILLLATLGLVAIARAQQRRGVYAPLVAWWRGASRLMRGLVLALVFTAVAYGSDKILGGHIGEGMRMLGGAVTSLCTNMFTAAERQTGYAASAVRTNEAHDLAMPAEAQMAERIARRGAHNDGFYFFDAYTNRLAHDGLDLGKPVWVHTDGTVTVRSPAPGVPIEELALTAVYSNITVYAPLQSSYGFLPASKWPDFMPSLIWTATTDRGSRVVTWEGARLERDVAQPVSFQAEFHANGEVTYRYNPAQTNFTGIGLYRGGTAQTFALSDLQDLIDNQDPHELTTNNLQLTTLRLAYIGDLGDGTGDADEDGLTNWEEIKRYHTDPHLADTDCDGVGDGYEIQNVSDPLNPDSDGDGIPDGTTNEAWSNNVLRATETNANFSIRLSAPLPNGETAAFRIADLTLLLDTNEVYLLLSEEVEYQINFAVHGSSLVRLLTEVAVQPQGQRSFPTSAEPLPAAWHFDDPSAMLDGTPVNSGRATVSIPSLSLKPASGYSRCVHQGNECRFTVDMRPNGWNVAKEFADLDGFVLNSEGTISLFLDDGGFADGTLVLGAGYFRHGSLFLYDSIHSCDAWGLPNCHLCNLHESVRCSHSDDCEAVLFAAGECTCQPLFIRVNIDDDNCNGVEDRNDSIVNNEDDMVVFRPVGSGLACCCEEFDAPIRTAGVSSLPSCIRATKDGSAFSGGNIQSGESLILEAVSPSGSGSAITYVVHGEGDGENHTVSRTVVAANALLFADYNDDLQFDRQDAVFAEERGMSSTSWLLPVRNSQYRLRVRHEIPSDASLRAYVSGNGSSCVTCPGVSLSTEGTSQYFNLGSGSGFHDMAITSTIAGKSGTISLTMVRSNGETYSLGSHSFTTLGELEVVLSPVTSEESNGKVVNPAGCVLGTQSTFKISVAPQAYPDGYIKWTSSNSGYANFTSPFGREVVVSPTQSAPNSLSVDIPYLTGSAPQISYTAYPSLKMVSVNFTFIRDSLGTMPGGISDANAYIASLLADANKVFTQAGMLFVKGTTSFVNNGNWYDIPFQPTSTYRQRVTEICLSQASCTGVKIFINNSFYAGQGAIGHAVTPCQDGISYCIISPYYMSARDLTHEVGHACGLNDIYGFNIPNSPATFSIMHFPVLHDDLPLDWTGLSDYYPTGTTRHNIVAQLLMMGFPALQDPRSDIPRGEVYGISLDDMTGNATTNMVNVGLSAITRDPVSLGGP